MTPKGSGEEQALRCCMPMAACSQPGQPLTAGLEQITFPATSLNAAFSCKGLSGATDSVLCNENPLHSGSSAASTSLGGWFRATQLPRARESKPGRHQPAGTWLRRCLQPILLSPDGVPQPPHSTMSLLLVLQCHPL